MSDCDSSPETRLASYGSLAPGRVNNDQLAALNGRWVQGTVRGNRVDEGWGAGIGYPGLILDASGPAVEVHVFESSDLPSHWPRLDEFEGPGYRRVITQISTPDGELSAYIYVIAT
jgi:gamma-glutamylcyclotransferase (GGCT)/AIG2-like uncharacterized protein YtfP